MSLETTMGAVMTAYPYSIEIDAHVSSARAMLAQYNIRHLPVRDGENWVGVITERHLQAAEDLGVDISVTGNARIRDLCKRMAYTVEPDELLVHVLRYMAAQNFDSVLVVKGGKLQGIFTFTDALKRYADLLAGK